MLTRPNTSTNYHKYSYPEEFAGIRVTTPPYTLPVTIEEVRSALRKSADCQDNYLKGLIMAATAACAQYQHRSLVTQTLKQTLDYWQPEIVLQYPRLQSVTSVKYLDADGDQQTLAADQYNVDTLSEPARITPAKDVTWPTLYGQQAQIEIVFVAGYEEIEGTVETEITAGAQTSVTVENVDNLPNPTGVIYVVNASGQYETFNYTAAYVDSSDVYTFTVGKTFTHTYAVGDTVKILTVPEETRQAIIATAAHLFEHPEERSEQMLYNNFPIKRLMDIHAFSEV